MPKPAGTANGSIRPAVRTPAMNATIASSRILASVSPDFTPAVRGHPHTFGNRKPSGAFRGPSGLTRPCRSALFPVPDPIVEAAGGGPQLGLGVTAFAPQPADQ